MNIDYRNGIKRVVVRRKAGDAEWRRQEEERKLREAHRECLIADDEMSEVI